MSSQDASPFSDASIHQARRQSGVLTPSSQSVCHDDIGSLGSKKRKRDGNSLEDLLKDTFVVKPYPSKANTRPRTFQPIILLPRSQLPLSYLDVGSATNSLPQSRLFETHVKILELEERMGNQPMVLIARLDDNRTLYAVERESRGLYVVLQLGSWVNIHQLRSSAVVAQTERTDVPVKGLLFGSTHFETSTEPLITPEGSKYTKKKRLAIEAIQSMIKRPSTPLLPESRPQSVAPEKVPASEPQNDTQATICLPASETKTQATSTEIFDNVRTQYFESLYLSKTSLAYFAKGPLSRARAAFHLDFDANLDMSEHIAFLESLVLSSTLLDKKYRDGVPVCVSSIDIHDQSADDTTVKPKRRKSNKKMKPGKNGLYPNEESLIKQWWISHDEEIEPGAPGSSKEELAKTRIANLRIRETQLQMIVILEIFALQPLVSTNENLEGGLPSLPINDGIIQSKERTPKTRKQDHLTMLIDVHIDRLCIWQSIASEAIKAPDTSSGLTSNNTLKHTDNILKDFCIEVIVPFFSARLPDRCDAINRKLGGPITKSVSKPRVSKAASFSNTLTRPGTITKRPVPAKQKKSLQRVLTDDRERRSMSIGSNRAISLMRSATDPTIPGLKRETSEAPSLSSIPSAEFKPLHVNRGGVLNSKRFSQREVDMSTLAPDPNSKAKKQAAIDAELKDAISALKKPNRELAGKALVETAERRSASAGHPRKSKKPVRNPLFQAFQSVQIKATPKTNRQKDMFGESQSTIGRSRDFDQMELGIIPPSSVPTIPQSKARPSYDLDPFRDSVQATPTRKPLSSSFRSTSYFTNLDADYGAIPPSSPLQMRRSSAQLFNSVPDSVVKIPSLSSVPSNLETPIKRPSPSTLFTGIQETPLKETPLKGISLKETPMKDTPVRKISEWISGYTRPAGPSNEDQENIRDVPVALEKMKPTQVYKKEVSYYEALGWNDDDIDDLA
ncbi:hypothetical protein BELL_0278g00120 [Botrytis elliptica]|uniref:DNA replication regulator Sld3 C-terminal domain-containing protein n=1 Tax=Botrytis elliptica TaxID=278938 RepID=A0A4Z1JSG7_9HELO|nr:hypothetical protein EAE99_004962 [Botrytis elliptica]TGO74500.1 hypothetical protein BELL_0278g00120 [Botrytis elliptica]